MVWYFRIQPYQDPEVSIVVELQTIDFDLAYYAPAHFNQRKYKGLTYE